MDTINTQSVSTFPMLNVKICEEKLFFSIDSIFQNDPERNCKEIETAFLFLNLFLLKQ